MALYSDAMDLMLAVPTPKHAQSTAAREAVEAVVRDGHRRRIEAIAAGFVTEHGRPRVEPWPGDAVPAAARRLAETARSHGWEVQTLTSPGRCTVEGVREHEGFRATWVRGRATGGTWHAPLSYGLIEDKRPAPRLNEKSRTSIAHRRPVGTTRIRLELLASPSGLPMNIATLTARIAS